MGRPPGAWVFPSICSFLWGGVYGCCGVNFIDLSIGCSVCYVLSFYLKFFLVCHIIEGQIENERGKGDETMAPGPWGLELNYF